MLCRDGFHGWVPMLAGDKMDLYAALDIDLNKDELLCFVGAGGKTTAMFSLAMELRKHAKKVLVTTTTALFYPDEKDCNKVIVSSESDIIIPSGITEGIIIVCGREVTQKNKLLGVDKALIDKLYEEQKFNYILVEADGSKRRPIKAPAAHEPVIPGSTTRLIGVIGLDALGKRIDEEYVHRPEMLCKVTGAKQGDVIGEDVIARLIVSPAGLFKAVPENCPKYLLLNKAEDRERKTAAMSIIKRVKKDEAHISGFIVANLDDVSISIG
jgi:probable selenium-dependent hydroxylase accessory protein YqeC